jgi:hypothetical protein
MVAAPAVSDIERSPSGDEGPAAQHCFDDRSALVGRLKSVVGTDTSLTGRPPHEETLAAVAERVVRSIVGPGDEAVEGDAEIDRDDAHTFNPSCRTSTLPDVSKLSVSGGHRGDRTNRGGDARGVDVAGRFPFTRSTAKSAGARVES